MNEETTQGTVVETSEEITTEFHSKKSEVLAKLSPAELEALREERRHKELLASFNRKQRRAYLSGRRAGLSEVEAINAIRVRR